MILNKKVISVNWKDSLLAYVGGTFLNSCHEEGEHVIKDVEIDLKKYEEIEQQPKVESDNKDLERVFKNILSLLRDPEAVARNLKPLNDELGERMKGNGISYSDADFPAYLIAGAGYFIAGAPPQNYKPRKQGRMLDALLKEHENAHGINLNGVPKFVGFVKSEEAEEIIKSGNIFSEDVQAESIFLHSKYSHRLAFEVIRNAVKSGELDLKIGDKNITQSELLNLMISTQDSTRGNAWNCMIDRLDDQFAVTISRGNVAGYSFGNIPIEDFTFSCRSPYSFNSLITCFGAEFGLENLQHYMLNSQWKEAARLVKGVRVKLGEEFNNLSKENDKLVNDRGERAKTSTRYLDNKEVIESFEKFYTDFENVYIHCMKCLGVLPDVSSVRITKTAEEAAKAKKYESFSEKFPSIKRKITSPKEIGYYDSMEAYIEEIAKEEAVISEDVAQSKEEAATINNVSNPAQEMRPGFIQRFCSMLRAPKIFSSK